MRSTDDPDFDAAWLAFAREEAHAAVPPELERRVLARALQCTPPAVASSRASRWRLPALAATAATMVLTTVAVLWFGRERPGVIAAQPAWDRDSYVALRAPVTGAPADADRRVVERREALPRLPAVSRAMLAELPPPLLRFSPQPIGEAEVLQIVRLRLPREVLQALGVVLVEPDAEGMVDVDVLVGEDGLARDIRQVSTGQE